MSDMQVGYAAKRHIHKRSCCFHVFYIGGDQWQDLLSVLSLAVKRRDWIFNLIRVS
jgi:hypothetical protein